MPLYRAACSYHSEVAGKIYRGCYILGKVLEAGSCQRVCQLAEHPQSIDSSKTTAAAYRSTAEVDIEAEKQWCSSRYLFKCYPVRFHMR